MGGKKDGSLSSFLAGAAAGAVDTCITMPLDTIKTNLQINPRLGLLGCAKNIGKKVGLVEVYIRFSVVLCLCLYLPNIMIYHFFSFLGS